MKKCRVKTSFILTALFLAGCSSLTPIQPSSSAAAYTKPRVLANFNDYVRFLKSKALTEGVSESVVNAQNNIDYLQKSIDLDRAQAGKIKNRHNSSAQANPNGATNYLNKVLTENKVDVALRRYDEVKLPLRRAGSKFGVPPEYLLALWGMESGFGYYQGRYDVLSALATLAFDGRREMLFSREFINAMKMLDRHYIDREKMLGSWAGAMGQTQFMPSAYLNYAADGNNDGKKNIWTEHDDIFASIANYLSQVGWNEKLPWGMEVTLTQPLDLTLSGAERNQARSFSAWQKLGVMPKGQTHEIREKTTALSHAELWLIRPDRENGRAFLVSNNFRTLLNWNKSTYFALSIGMFADRIKAKGGWH